jgi:hypothetical protein
MANHSFVKNCKRDLNPEEIRALLESFCEKHLKGLFRVEDFLWNDSNGWFVRHHRNGQIGCAFWISKFTEEYDENEEPINHTPAIEHRHGHCVHFEWWLCSEIQNHLARELGGEVWDEGIGPCHDEKNPLPTEFRPLVIRPDDEYQSLWVKMDMEQMPDNARDIINNFYREVK